MSDIQLSPSTRLPKIRNNKPKNGATGCQLPEPHSCLSWQSQKPKVCKGIKSAKFYRKEAYNFFLKHVFQNLFSFLSRHVYSLKSILHPWNGYLCQTKSRKLPQNHILKPQRTIKLFLYKTITLHTF